MIEQLSKIRSEDLIVKEASPKEGIAKLFDRMDQLNKTKGNTIQAFDYDGIINKTQLLAAYINALMAFDSRSNKAKPRRPWPIDYRKRAFRGARKISRTSH